MAITAFRWGGLVRIPGTKTCRPFRRVRRNAWNWFAHDLPPQRGETAVALGEGLADVEPYHCTQRRMAVAVPLRGSRVLVRRV
jgi:hypothetical protein